MWAGGILWFDWQAALRSSCRAGSRRWSWIVRLQVTTARSSRPLTFDHASQMCGEWHPRWWWPGLHLLSLRCWCGRRRGAPLAMSGRVLVCLFS